MDSSKTFNQILSGASPWRQILSVSCLFWVSLSIGYSQALINVMLTELAKGTDGYDLSSEFMSWFASAGILAAMPCNIIGGIIASRFGRKFGAILSCPTFIIGYLLIYSSTPQLNLLLYGRVGIGMASGLQHVSLASYFSEVTSPQLRTGMFTAGGAIIGIGMILPILLAIYSVSWSTMTLWGILPPALGLLSIYFIPESPTWCVTRGKIKEARANLLILRGPDYPVEDELKYLVKSYAFVNKDKSSWKGICARMMEPDVWKPLIIVQISFLLNVMVFMSSLDRYGVLIFQASGSSLGSYESVIPFQFVKIISNFFGSFFLFVRYERRHVFMASSVLNGIGLAGLGLSIMYNPSRSADLFSPSSTSSLTQVGESSVYDDNSFLNFIPIISCCLVSFSFSCGVGPIPWVYGNELFPIDIRSHLCGITTSIMSAMSFIQVKTFPLLLESVGVGETFLLASGITIVTTLWGLFGLPETKGATLHQITRMFYSEKQLRRKRLESEGYLPNPDENSTELRP